MSCTKPKKLLPFDELGDRVRMGRTKIYEEIAAGNFPRPVKTGKRGVAWVDSEIDDWIERRIAERDAEHDNVYSTSSVSATASPMGVEAALPATHRRSSKPMSETLGAAK
jgi:prophage regulatory protein